MTLQYVYLCKPSVFSINTLRVVECNIEHCQSEIFIFAFILLLITIYNEIKVENVKNHLLSGETSWDLYQL